jgi:hypothetical protein
VRACVGLRGSTADVIILEEAAFMDPSVFQVVCVPLLGVDHTALLAISTPDSEFNFYTELFYLTNEKGEPFFSIISIGLACDECLANGLQCSHRNDKLPHWRPLERQALIQAILGNNVDLANRETRGVVQSSMRNLYDKKWIKRLLDSVPSEWTYKPDVIFIGIDPAGNGHSLRANFILKKNVSFILCVFLCLCDAGGGNHSDFAICTMAYDGSKHVVKQLFIGVEAPKWQHARTHQTA